MTEAPAHELRHVGKKTVDGKDPRPGRLAGEVGPSSGNDGGGDGGHDHGNGGAHGKTADQTPAVTGVRRLGMQTMNVSRPRPYRGLPKKKGNSPDGVDWKPLRAAPPPPSGDRNSSVGSNASRSHGDSETTQASQGMTTLQRMLTPPVSDTSSPPQKKQESCSDFVRFVTHESGIGDIEW